MEDAARSEGLVRESTDPSCSYGKQPPPDDRSNIAKGKKTVITASVVQDAARAGKTEITLDAAAILTPLARDEARERGIRFVRSDEK